MDHWYTKEYETFIEDSTGRTYFLCKTDDGRYALDRLVAEPVIRECIGFFSSHSIACQELARRGCVDANTSWRECLRLRKVTVDSHTDINTLCRMIRKSDNTLWEKAITELRHRGPSAKAALPDLIHFVLDDIGNSTHSCHSEAVTEAITALVNIAPGSPQAIETLTNLKKRKLLIQIRYHVDMYLENHAQEF